VNRILDASPAPKLGFVVTGADPTHAYGYTYASYTDRRRVRRSWRLTRGRRRERPSLEAVESLTQETLQRTTSSAARARRRR
jgi:hypothetical protein